MTIPESRQITTDDEETDGVLEDVDESHSPLSVSGDRPEQTAIETLYAKLDEASRMFAMLRQEPYFSTVELDELVSLAGHAKDSTNWLRAQRDKTESLAADRPVENSRMQEADDEETCPCCGNLRELRRNFTHSGKWGDGPEVEFYADAWYCAHCKEETLNPRQADQWTINLLKATVSRLKESRPVENSELPEKLKQIEKRVQAWHDGSRKISWATTFATDIGVLLDEISDLRAERITKEEAQAILDAGDFSRHLKDFEGECPVCTGAYKLSRISGESLKP